MIDGEIPCPGRKPLVEPQFIPPLHGNQISKPLMSQFVGYDIGGFQPDLVRGRLLVKENFRGSIGDQTPVFHGS